MSMLPKKCHFVGIGGIGMSGLARILLQKGISVSGSDLKMTKITDELQKAGAAIYQGHCSQQVPTEAVVVYSSGITQDNIELKCQNDKLHRSELLMLLMKEHKSLVVTGSHGKTTTSALLASVCSQGGWQPAYAIGGTVLGLGNNSDLGGGKWFVAEADESDGSFLNYSPYGAIITNIDREHLAHYKSEDNLIKSFQQFAEQVESHLVWCGDDSRLSSLGLGGKSYGFHTDCDWKICNYRQLGWKSLFDLNQFKEIEIPLVGRHNALNASAVFALCYELGMDEKSIREGFSQFKGVSRRLEFKGESCAVSVYDDYAHHPTEIAATLAALKVAVREKEVIALFQPHRFSRVKELFSEFSGAFTAADRVIVTDIYTAQEEPIKGITGEVIAQSIKGAVFVPKKNLIDYLHTTVRPHSVVITLGAGDLSKIGVDVLSNLDKSPIPSLKVGLLGGGRSPEHFISLRSMENISQFLPVERYMVEKFIIPKQGPFPTKETFEKLMGCDVLFPILHGPFGEDGTIQGFFEMIQKPYVGCDWRSSALSMDKGMSKKIAHFHQIQTAPFLEVGRLQWKKNRKKILRQIAETLTYPLFVKPSHLGSSIGVEKVMQKEELEPIIDRLLSVDTPLVIENQIVGRELEFAVLGNEWIEVFPPGEIVTKGEVYNLEKKCSDAEMPKTRAELPHDLVEEGKRQALVVYTALQCQGMARVDFFLDENQQYWFNEINPIPGCTQLSLYPKICQANGYSLEALIDRLIVLALHRAKQ